MTSFLDLTRDSRYISELFDIDSNVGERLHIHNIKMTLLLVDSLLIF
jgi:hypothetical protein